MGQRRNLLALATSILAIGAVPQSASAETACQRVAAPTGSNTASGTVGAPYRTVQRLVSSLSAGQVGCLRGGTYAGSVKVSRGGASGSPIRLTRYGSESARVVGRFWIASGADNVVVDHLILDGGTTSLPSPSIYANYAAFRDNEVTNGHRAICFSIGQIDYRWHATGTRIERNNIHDCGKLPAANHDHGIYVENSTDTLITGNFIHSNADRGINLYPDARRTTITNNVIANNGEGILFSGDFGLATTDTLVQGNVIAYSKIRYNVEAWFPDGNPTGSGNAVRRNCIFKGARGNVDGAVQTARILVEGNIIGDPRFVNAAAGDYRMSSGSTCAPLLASTAASARTAASVSQLTTVLARASDPTPARPRRPAHARSSNPSSITLLAARSGRRVLARVKLQGRRSGRAALQVRRNGAWRTVARRHVRAGRTARMSYRLARSHGRLALRAKVSGVGVSPTLVLRAR
jgi:parallel beta-helix repeat protein